MHKQGEYARIRGIKKDPRAAYPGGERRKVSGVTGTGYEIRIGSGSRVPRSGAGRPGFGHVDNEVLDLAGDFPQGVAFLIETD